MNTPKIHLAGCPCPKPSLSPPLLITSLSQPQHLLFPPALLALQLRVAVCGGGLGRPFSTPAGHLLEPVLPCQESSGREKNNNKKICYCILAGVSGTKRVLGALVWGVLEYSCSQWIEAPVSVDNKPSASGLLRLQGGSGISPASILGGRMLPALPKSGGDRNECC